MAFACAWAFTVPLFATATDWGRLLHTHLMATSVLVAAFGLDNLDASSQSLQTRRMMLRSYLKVCAIALGLSLLLLLTFRLLLPRALPLAWAFSIPLFMRPAVWGQLLDISVIVISVFVAAVGMDTHDAPRAPLLRARSTVLRVVMAICVTTYVCGWSIRHCCPPNGLGIGILTYVRNALQ
jgi:hypothetical protein